MARRPNVVLFVTDDHGAWANGFDQQARGVEPEIRTPTLDHLARTGVSMRRAFTPSPVCSPARACLWTGLMPSQTGVHDWLMEHHPEFVHRSWIEDRLTIPEILRDAGYQTLFSGKWHVGGSESRRAGFDRWFSITNPQGNHFGRFRYSDDGRMVEYDGYKTNVVTDRALLLLDGIRADQPFFLCVGYIGTHSPWQGHPERLVESYRACPFKDIPNLPMRPQQIEGFKKHFGNRETFAQYYASVTHIDENVGRILDRLDALGARGDTLVIYTSDHGLNCGHHGVWGKGNGTEPKNLYEGSIRVPLVFNDPASLSGGRALDEIVDHCDFLPTLLDYLGIARPDDRQLDALVGASYAPVLRGERQGWTKTYCGEYGPVRAVRTERFVYVHRTAHPDHHELFDLVNDPDEQTNLVDDPAYRATRDELHERLLAWFGKVDVCGRSGLEQPHDSPGQVYPPWTWA